jgi:hypothetical protein
MGSLTYKAGGMARLKPPLKAQTEFKLAESNRDKPH